MSSRQSKRKRKSKSSAVPFQSAVSLKKDEKEEDDNMLLKGNIAESDDEVEESSGDEFLDDSADEVEEKQDIESIFNGSAFGSDSERSSINGEDDDDANESSNSDSDEGDDTSDYTEDEEANLEDSGEDDDNEANNAQILQKEFRKKKGESTGDNSNGSDEPKLRSINTKDAIRKGDFERPENLAEQSDSSDDEGEKNRIGNVPLEWYDEFDHIGYDIKGQKIGRKAKGDALDDFLARSDPNFT